MVEQAAISRRYRDRVNPHFWGRIIGTSSDAESAEWLADKFRKVGLSDVRIPVRSRASVDAAVLDGSVTRGDETLALASAQPFYRSSGTGPEGMELEAVCVGLGSEANCSNARAPCRSYASVMN